jgi:NADH dehydrogenase (ubiquinone) Fe-S protein 5
MGQAARAIAIQRAYRKAEAAHPRENAPKAGSIRSLGLIGKEEETKEVLKAVS